MKREMLDPTQTDYILLLFKLWDARMFLLKTSMVGLLIGILIFISIPKEYETSIYTVPESTSGKIDTDEGFSSEVSIGGKKIQDAIIPSLYPEVVSSTPFLLSLFDIPITLSNNKELSTLTLSEYMSTHQRSPWWNTIRVGILQIISFPITIFSEKETNDTSNLQPTSHQHGETIDIFHLSKREIAIAAAINSRINVDVDKKKRTVTLHIRMQDPLVSATVADSVMAKLQKFVSDYRTKKECINLEHAENLYQQARKRYNEAQETYAHFADANQSLSLKLYQKELYNLQIAKDIAYKEYTETLQQLQFAKIRVYKKRPVFAIIEPATVPLSPVSPSKIKILSVIFLLSLAMGCGLIYFKTMPCYNYDQKDI